MLDKFFGGKVVEEKSGNELKERIKDVVYGPFDTKEKASQALTGKGKGWQVEEHIKGCPHAEAGVYLVNRLELRDGRKSFDEAYSTPWEACVNCRPA